MFRYIALIWHDDDAAPRETACRLIDRHSSHTSGWQVALRNKGTFCGVRRQQSRITEPHDLHAGAGVVLGKLFERLGNSPSTAAPMSLGESRTRAIIESRGRHLVEGYWGRYVAFLHDAAARTTRVLRDPSGGLPCLITIRFGGVRLYFSAMSDLAVLGAGPFDVNWGYLTAWLCVMRAQTHATGLREVSQVLSGECVELHDDVATSTFYWEPLRDRELEHHPRSGSRGARAARSHRRLRPGLGGVL